MVLLNLVDGRSSTHSTESAFCREKADVKRALSNEERAHPDFVPPVRFNYSGSGCSDQKEFDRLFS